MIALLNSLVRSHDHRTIWNFAIDILTVFMTVVHNRVRQPDRKRAAMTSSNIVIACNKLKGTYKSWA